MPTTPLPAESPLDPLEDAPGGFLHEAILRLIQRAQDLVETLRDGVEIMSSEVLHERFSVKLTARLGEPLGEPLSFLEDLVWNRDRCLHT